MRTLAALLLFSTLPARGQQTAGGEAFEFLLLDAGARPVALGGAYTALASDANALRYNPAGLAWAPRMEATAMHDQYFQGAVHEYLALASPSGWGASVNFLNFGNIARTTLSNHAGAGGSVGMNDLAVEGAYGRTIADSPDFGRTAVGLGLKFLHESLDNVGANGVAADAGLLWSHRSVPGLSIGLAALNFGPDASFQGKRERLPVDLRAGAAFTFTTPGLKNTVSLEGMRTRSDSADAAVGLESVVLKSLALRLAYMTRASASTGFVGGAGWTWQAWSFDYAVAAYGDLGLTNSLSLTYRWGEAPQEPSESGSIQRWFSGLTRRRRAADEAEPAGASKPVIQVLAPEALPPSSAAPADGDEHFALAQRFIQDRAYEQAKKELALASGSGDEEHRLRVYFERLGIVALDEDDIAKAVKLGRELGERATAADAFAGAGLCLSAQGEGPYAIKFYEKALQAEPSPRTRRWLEERLREAQAAKP